MAASSHIETPGGAELELFLEPRRWALGLGAGALVLVLLHLWVQVVHHVFHGLPWLFRGLFDLDEEQAFGTWYASFLLACAALAALVAGRAERAAGRGGAAWAWLAGGLAVLSLDEVAGLHETYNTLTEASWAWTGGALALLAGLAFTPFLLRLPRSAALHLVLAGLVYVGGAVGVELAAHSFEEHELETLAYGLTVALEEGLEMGGAVLFVRAALDHAARTLAASAGSRGSRARALAA